MDELGDGQYELTINLMMQTSADWPWGMNKSQIKSIKKLGFVLYTRTFLRTIRSTANFVNQPNASFLYILKYIAFLRRMLSNVKCDSGKGQKKKKKPKVLSL